VDEHKNAIYWNQRIWKFQSTLPREAKKKKSNAGRSSNSDDFDDEIDSLESFLASSVPLAVRKTSSIPREAVNDNDAISIVPSADNNHDSDNELISGTNLATAAQVGHQIEVDELIRTAISDAALHLRKLVWLHERIEVTVSCSEFEDESPSSDKLAELHQAIYVSLEAEEKYAHIVTAYEVQ
jgi:hypothetical protein